MEKVQLVTIFLIPVVAYMLGYRLTTPPHTGQSAQEISKQASVIFASIAILVVLAGIFPFQDERALVTFIFLGITAFLVGVATRILVKKQ